ncbi:MAG: DUF885 domain-containing protein [bacterium]|nr:MAG: DUF885 domain-containing protein [bacterium]
MLSKLRLFGILILICLVLTHCYVNTVQPQSTTTGNIEEIFTAFFREIIELNPEFASQLGVTEEMGVKYAKDGLTDVSEQAISHENNVYRKYQSILESYDPNLLTASQRLARDILMWHIEDQLAGEKFRYHQYIINPMFGVHNSLTTLMTEYHTIESIKDALDYISRLEKYTTKFDQLLKGLSIRKEKGIFPPKYIIETAEQEMSDFIAVDAKANVLYTAFRERFSQVENVDVFKRIELNEKVESSIKNFVYPSYKKFIDHLKNLKAMATEDAGAWKLPDGEAYYQYCLRFHTTTSFSPDEIHKMGFKEVRRIQNQAKKILKSLGIAKKEVFGAMMNEYWQKVGIEKGREFYYPNTERAKKQVLEDYQKIIDDLEAKLPDFFLLVPKTRVMVKPIPEFKASTMGAHYSPASMDGKRQGIFYVNLVNPPFKPGMKTLTYHEAIPGHHFQIAIQQESPENRLFRHLVYFTAYIEGWALYAEQLGMENGWFDDPYSKLGYLNSELFRAVRLVVDTGIHYKRWTRDQAYKYMVQNLGWGSYREIDRYVVWPGQACAYKIGELKLLEFRELAKKKLGKKFDIKEFHRAVLEHGSVPLDILERLVVEYIQND